MSYKEWVLKSNSWTYVIFDPEKLLQKNTTTQAVWKKYLINGKEHALKDIKASWAYKSIVESLDNLWVKWWTDDDIIAMLKKTQKPNTTNADRNRAITEIQKKYPRNVKPWKDDLPF